MRPNSNQSQSSNYVSLLNKSDFQKGKYSFQNTISSRVNRTSNFFNVFQSSQQKQPQTVGQNISNSGNFYKRIKQQKVESNTQNSSLTNSIKNLKTITEKLNTKAYQNSIVSNAYRPISNDERISQEGRDSKNVIYNFSPFYGRSKSNQAHLLDSEDKKQNKRLKTKVAQLQSTIVNLRFKNQHFKNKFQEIKNKYDQLSSIYSSMKIEIDEKNRIIQVQKEQIKKDQLKNSQVQLNAQTLNFSRQQLSKTKNNQLYNSSSSKKSAQLNKRQQKSTIKFNNQNLQFNERHQLSQSVHYRQCDNQNCKQLKQNIFILQDTNRELTNKIQWLNGILNREKQELEQLAKEIRNNAMSFKQRQGQTQFQINSLKSANIQLTQQKQHYLELIGDMQNKIGIQNEHNNQITKNTKGQIDQLSENLRLTQIKLANILLARQNQIKQLKKQKELEIQKIKLQNNKIYETQDKKHMLIAERQFLLQERMRISQGQIQSLKKCLLQRQTQLSQIITSSNQQKMYMLEQYKILQQQFTSSTLFFKNKVNALEKQIQKYTLEIKNQKFQAQNHKRLFQNKIIYQLKKQNEDLRDQNMYYRCGYNDKQTAYYRKNYAKSLQKKLLSNQRQSSNLNKSTVSQIKDSQLSSFEEQKRLIKEKVFKNKLHNQQERLKNLNNKVSPMNIQNSRQKHLNAQNNIQNNIIPICIPPLSQLERKDNQQNIYQSRQSNCNLENFDKKEKQIQERYQNFMKLLKNKFGIGKEDQI